MKIPVMEIFGPTIQGEGKLIGQKTMFLRTAGCDYSCAWCDSAFTWDGSERPRLMTPHDVVEALKREGKTNFKHLTISGGNPALLGTPIEQLITLLHAEGIQVSVETQGTMWQDWLLLMDEVTLSPKPPSSGMVTDFEKLDVVIERLVDAKVAFSMKIVVFNEVDLAYAKQVFSRYRTKTDAKYVSVGNPNPRSGEDVRMMLLERLHQLFDWVITDPELNDVKPLPQLHTLVWNNERGV